MTVHYFIGRTGTGKTETMHNRIIKESKDDPSGPPIILLVPDQMTFISEQKLIKKHTIGLQRAQVYSFPRLVRRILQEKGGLTYTFLQKQGMHVLLRKVMEEHKSHFKLFTKSSDTPGFIENMDMMLKEFQRYNVEPGHINNIKEQAEQKTTQSANDKILSDKLSDILLLWEKIEQEMEGRFVGLEDYLPILRDKLPHSKMLEGCRIYIDGFHSFTPQEMEILTMLIEKAEQTTIALTMDKSYIQQDTNPLDLFKEPADTFHLLQHMTADKEQQVIIFESEEDKDAREPELRHLEAFFEKRPVQTMEQAPHVHMWSPANKRVEVDHTARTILEKVKEEGYRFKDIAVMARNIGDYDDLLQTSFRDHGIPLFTDQTKKMEHHPVLEFLRSVLEWLTESWRYEAVFRAVKTDMLFPVSRDWESCRKDMDRLENYVLAYGIKEKHWKSKENWSFSRFRTSAGEDYERSRAEEEIEQLINEQKELIKDQVLPLEKRLKKGTTVEAYTAALYRFLEELDIPKKLEKLRDVALEHNDLTKAGEHEQVWSELIELFDQIVEVAGDEKMSMTRYRKLLEAGLESLLFRLVPPAIDQVSAADMERSRLEDVKLLFVLGVNEGIIPSKMEEDGILGDEDRRWFEESGISLANTSSQKLLNESFLVYRALSLPSRELYISYPLANEKGEAQQPSILISQLKDMMPTLQEEFVFAEPQEFQSKEQEALFVHSSRRTLSQLIYQLQRWKSGEAVSDIWWGVYNWYAQNPGAHPDFVKGMESIFYRNKAYPLTEQMSTQLYGTSLKASVSRVEQFEKCAFAHFASYGLRLKERDTYTLEAPDIGQFFHAALKDMTEAIQSEGKEWKDITEEECVEKAAHAVNQLAPKVQREILSSSAKHAFVQKKLQETITRASLVMRKQSIQSAFSPIALEVAFGEHQDLPPMTFTLENGTKMEIAGRIDRVDRAEGPEGLLLRVIDYKSSVKDIRLSEVYFGLALQMLVYLDIVMTYAEEWIGEKADPAGILYFHIHDPFVNVADDSADDIEERLFKEYKMKGLIMDDEESVRLMDTDLQEGHSTTIPARMKKGGELSKTKSTISRENFQAIHQFIQQKLLEAGEQIMHGSVEINPYKIGNDTACTFCSFRAVCQFDQQFEANHYRVLKADEKTIKKELLGEGESADEQKNKKN